jgi:RHS repeat-associated protein
MGAFLSFRRNFSEYRNDLKRVAIALPFLLQTIPAFPQSVAYSSLDPVIIPGDSGRVFRCNGDGAGNFSSMVELENLGTSYARCAAVADFDEDGILDFVAGNGASGYVYMYFYKGNLDGTYAPKRALPQGPWSNSWAMDAAAGDFNGDGHVDFIANTNYTYTAFYFGDGTGNFTQETRDLVGYGRGMDAGDFNEDGKLDFLRGRYSDGLIELYTNDGTGHFTATSIWNHPQGDPYGLAAADFDGDGHLDFIVGGGWNGDPYFLRGNGDGTFGPPIYVSSADLDNHMAYDAYDYDRDGKVDLVAVNYSGQQAFYFRGNGDGTFASRVALGGYLGDNCLGISAPPDPIPVDLYVAPPDQTIALGEAATLTVTGNMVGGSTSINWRFGDGGTGEGETASHAYAAEGVYFPFVAVTTSAGKTIRQAARVQVNGDPPVARAGGPYIFGETAANQDRWTATLDGSSSSDDFGITAYTWSFGDGTTGSGPTPSHTWPSRGPWNVILTVTDGAGQTNSATTTVTFNPGAPPVAVLRSPTGTEPAVFDESFAWTGVWTVTFDAGGSSDDVGIWRYEWSFGDGTGGSGNPISHGFGAAGNYTVQVTVYDNASQSATASLAVIVKANDLPVPHIAGPDRIAEDAATKGCWRSQWDSSASTDDRGIWRVEWDFGDGGTSTEVAPAHDFCAPAPDTTFTVRLTVYDHGRQPMTATQAVTVVGNELPVARIAASTTSVEGTQSFELSGEESTDDFGIASYRWRFPETLYEFSGTSINTVDWFVSPGVTQNDKLVVSGTSQWDNRCFFAQTAFGRGTILQGEVETSLEGYSHCMVGFKNLSMSGNYPEFTYAIYFASGYLYIYEYGSSPGWFATYTQGGKYDFRIETLQGSGARYLYRPHGAPDFILLYTSGSYSDPNMRFGATIHTGTWGFDNWDLQAIASGPKTTASLSRTGSVELTVTDNANQTGSATIDISVLRGEPPTALIDGPARGGIGVDLTFSAARSHDDYGIARCDWDFGDGVTATGEWVTHFYTSAGTKPVRLTVFDYAGQSSTATLNVIISGESLVQAVPWRIIGELEVPHDVIAGKSARLKAVAGNAAIPVSWTWDFGDGSPPVSGIAETLSQAYSISAEHAYSGSDGTPYTATITIQDASGARASDTYPVTVRDRSLEVEMNIAIDEGLWYLHRSINRTSINVSVRGGYWTGSGYSASATGSAVQAFEINGHIPTGDAMRDPYIEDVNRGLNHLLTQLSPASIGPQTFGNPDTNGNGIALYASSGQPVYELGQVMDAFVATGAPNLVSMTGGTNVIGRPMKDIVQDCMDMYFWGQTDWGDPYGGGWRYSWNSDSDNSVCQWAAIGCIAGQDVFGLTIPQWVKDRNLVWLHYSSSGGVFYYTSGGCVTDYCFGTTPSGMVQLAMDDVTIDHPLWRESEDYMVRYWNQFLGSGNIYGYYAFAKAMRLVKPEPVSTLRGTGLNWFLDPDRGLARILVDRQRSDGYWDGWSWLDSGLTTPWSIIILSSTLFQKPPVAVIHAGPNPGAVGQAIRFDGSPSYHMDPMHKIVAYQWDFDDRDGIDWEHPDEIGPVATHAFGALGNYTVTLRVIDDNSPILTDTCQVQIQITIPPHPPTAIPGGPYLAAVGESILLDGSASYDIDAGEGDRITAYGWEIDDVQPRDFDEATGPKPLIPAFTAAGTRTIGLRVTDDTARSFPYSGQPNLTDDAFTQVVVYPKVIDNLVARPKDSKIQLTWSPRGAERFEVFRSELAPNAGFARIAVTYSQYSTYLDQGIQLNKRYYYRVLAYAPGETTAKGSSSTAVVTSSSRSTDRNRPPKITTLPVLEATESLLYSYDVDATDLDRDAITYALIQGPEGMAIDAGSGRIAFTPERSQLGIFTVCIEAQDPKGGVGTQVYDLLVKPRENTPPLAEANGPYEGVAGTAIAFSSAGTQDDDGDPITFLWSFGDGETSTDPNPFHVYGAAGTYVATLIVRDDRDGVGTDQAAVQVGPQDRPPIAVAGDDVRLRLGEVLKVDGSGSSDLDGDPLTFRWNFGDSTEPVEGVRAEHTYTEEGVYTVTLEVNDGRGGLDTDSLEATVGPRNQDPIVVAAGGGSGNVGEVIVFDGTGTYDPDGDPLTYSWDFGDGSTMSGLLVSHRYEAPGSFTATFTVQDDHGGTGIATVPVHINAPPVFASAPVTSVLQDQTYSYRPEVTDADGDAISLVLASGPPGMVLDGTGTLVWTPGNADVGEHGVTLQASDGKGRFAEQRFTITVVNVNDPPEITSAPPLSVREEVTYAYDVRAYDPDGDSVRFFLDDGPAGMTLDAIGGQLRWTPDDPDVGIHDIQIHIEDGQGGVGRQSYRLTVVEVNDPPRIVSSPPTTLVIENSLFSYDVEALDPDDGALVFSLGQAPPGMTIDAASGLIRWTPDTSNPPQVSVQVVVEDGRGGTGSQSFTITVQDVNDPPVFTTTPVLGGQERAEYRYDADTTDEEGDPVTYSLLVSPAGMTIEATTGLVLWTPAVGESGSHPVSIAATDSKGAAMVQSYTLIIRQGNQPPEIKSTPLTVALEDSEYTYQVVAEDPDGDALSYSLTVSPTGMKIDASTGLIRWTPEQTDAGENPVTIVVKDIFDAEDSQSYTMGVAAVNDDPVITSTPVLSAEARIAYIYAVTARDEENDPIAFSLTAAPMGMTIGSSTGLITWTAAPEQVGPHAVQVVAADGNGGSAAQEFTVTVTDEGHTPVVRAILDQTVLDPEPFAPIRLDDLVEDPDNPDPEIVWTFSGNSELSVSIGGDRVATIGYATGTRVTETITFTATDPDGLTGSATASFTVAAPSGGVPPTLTSITPSTGMNTGPQPVELAGENFKAGATVTLSRLDQLGVVVQATGLIVASEQRITCSLDLTGLSAGAWDVTVTNPDKGFGFLAGGFLVEALGGGAAPTVAIAGPAEDTELSAPTDILGSVGDPDGDLSFYLLQYSPAGENAWTTAYRGTGSVSDGLLGTLDTTAIANGVYDVRLYAEDLGGNTNSISHTYRLAGELKVGLFTVSFSDVSVPVRGIPVTVTRTYDSRVKTRGDFGCGWSLDVSSLKLEENTLMGEDWEETRSGGWFPTYDLHPAGEHSVSMSWPDGRTEKFGIQSVPSSQQLVPIDYFETMVFNPVPPATSSLAPLGDAPFMYTGGIPGTGDILDMWYEIYNPTGYLLTTREGQRYTFMKADGTKRACRLTAMEDLNGNRVVFGADGVVHQPTGIGVTLTRDALGRVATATDPNGNVTSYQYDARGDLVAVTNPIGEVTRFRYNSTHGLIEILDPRGLQPTRNEYDASGKLVAIIDPLGKRTEFVNDPNARQEVVTDRLGNLTVYEYDPNGRVTSKTDSQGNRTEYTYDERGNKLTEKDPLGRTAAWTYDASNNVLSHTDFNGATTASTYNDRNQVLTSTDPLGNVVTNSYDDRGNLTGTSRTAADGALLSETVSAYDASGNLLSSSVKLSATETATTTYEHDGAGNRTASVDPLGRRTEFTYDSNGNKLTETSTRTLPDGSTRTMVSQFRYDGLNRLVKEIDSLLGETSTTYNAIGKVASKTDKNGNVTQYEYDPAGNLERTLFADGTSETAKYDAEGRRIESTDRGGRTTVFKYDTTGNLLKTILPDDTPDNPDDNPFVETSYDGNGRVLTRTDERRNTTSYFYFEKTETEPRRQVVQDALGNETTYEFDDAGNRTRMVDALSHETRFEYDGQNRLVKTIYPDGTFTSIEYDLGGRKVAEIDQAGVRTEFRYDLLGRLVEVIDALHEVPADKTTRYAYDEAGNRISQTDAEGRATRFEYDDLGRLKARVLPLGQRETFEYDDNGNQIRKVDFNGAATTSEYDWMNRLVRQRLPEGNTIVFEYTATGKRLAVTDPRGRRTAYGYDARERLVVETNPDGSSLAYTYDAAGNRTSITTAVGVTNYTFDELNRLDTVVDPDGDRTTYGYDDVGNRKTVAYPNGTTTTYDYDDLNRLLVLTNTGPSGVISRYTYTLAPAGGRTKVVESGSATTGRSVEYTYDILYRLTQEKIDEPDDVKDQTIAYVYDAVGNRMSRESTIGTERTTTTYSYDTNDRLLTEARTITVAQGRVDEREKGYWAVVFPVPSSSLPWNILLVLVGICALGLALPPALLLRIRNRALRRRKHRLAFQHAVILLLVPLMVFTPGQIYGLSVDAVLNLSRAALAQASPGTTTYTFDNNGNTLSRSDGTQTDTYGFDSRNRLVSALVQTGPEPGAIAYEYDVYGIRVSKTVNGTRTDYLVDHNQQYAQVLVEESSGKTVSYLHGDDLISMKRPADEGGKVFYLTDGQMSSRQLINITGSVINNYSYDVYGVILDSQETTNNVYLFAGEQLDPNLGIYYLRARYLDHHIGRFLCVDPFEGINDDPITLHKYLYARNNPVNCADPSGEMGEFSLSGLMISIAISATINAIVNYRASEGIWGVFTNLVVGALEGAVFYGISIGALRLLIGFSRYVKFERASRAIGAIFSRISGSGPIYSGTDIPKYFIFNTHGGRVFITQNATEHLFELLKYGSAGQTKIASSLVLSDLEVAITQAARQGALSQALSNGTYAFAVGRYTFVFAKETVVGVGRVAVKLIHLAFWG